MYSEKDIITINHREIFSLLKWIKLNNKRLLANKSIYSLESCINLYKFISYQNEEIFTDKIKFQEFENYILNLGKEELAYSKIESTMSIISKTFLNLEKNNESQALKRFFIELENFEKDYIQPH